jgi:hypothetical protein
LTWRWCCISNAVVEWLRVAGAAIELHELAAALANRATEHSGTPESRGSANAVAPSDN